MVDLAKNFGLRLAALLVPLAAASGARAEGEQPLPALPASSTTTTEPGSPPASAAGPVGAAPVATAAPPSGPPPAIANPAAPPSAGVDTGCSEGRSHCHDGLYLRMASGVGATSVTGHGPSGSVSISGGSIPYRLAIGGTVGRAVVLGVALFGAATLLGPSTSGVDGAKASFGGLNFLVDWYPSPEGGWHLGGDVGIGLVTLTNGKGAGGDLTASVFGGYDWWFADQWSFGPMLAVSGGSQAAINDSNGNDTGYRLRAGTIALLASFLYH